MNPVRALPIFALSLALPHLSHADTVPTLVAQSTPVVEGQQADIFLVLLNPDSIEQSYPNLNQLRARVTGPGGQWDVTLTPAEGAPRIVRPGGFAKRHYQFTMPDAAAGQVVVELADTRYEGLSAVMQVQDGGQSSPALVGATPEAKSSPLAATVAPEPAMAAVSRTFASRLSPHEPIYFLYGTDDPNAKFQFSFKYKLMSFGDGGKRWLPPTAQFGFTQRSLWDLGAESSPFYDTSYMPEFMIEMLGPRDQGNDWITWLGANAGYRHESNGRDGLDSRSLNTLNASLGVAFGNLEGWHLIVIPEVQTYIFGLEDNPDLRQYRGYGRLRMAVGRADGPSLMATGIVGEGWENITMQYDLYVPVSISFIDFETYFMVQYFDGYGESLRNYDQRVERLRAGFSFVR